MLEIQPQIFVTSNKILSCKKTAEIQSHFKRILTGIMKLK